MEKETKCQCDHDHEHEHENCSCGCGCEHHEEDAAMESMHKGMENQMSGKYEDAIKNYEDTIVELAKREGEDGPDIGYCKHYIASCLSSLGKFDEAFDMYNKALELHSKNFGEKSSAVGRVYSELGLINYNLHKFSETLKYEDKALYIFANDVEANPVEKAMNKVICCDIKGSCYRTCGLLGDAIKCFEDAKQGLNEAQYQADDAFANYAVSIGQCYLDLEQYDKSEENFQIAVDLYKKDVKNFSTALVNALVFLAATKVHQEKYDEMLKTFDEAFKVVEENAEKDCMLFKELAVTAGDMCAYAMKIDKAMEYYKLVVRVDKTDDKDETKAVYQYAYKNLAECAAHLGKMGEAMEYSELANK